MAKWLWHGKQTAHAQTTQTAAGEKLQRIVRVFRLDAFD
jgi:hypothetical protein